MTIAWLLSATLWLGVQERSAPRIRLGEVSTFPGESAVLPLRLDGERTILQFSVRLSFPRELTFREARPSKSAAGLVVKTTPGERLDTGRATLLLVGTSAEGVQPGRVLDVVFDITKQLYESTAFEVQILDSSWRQSDGIVVENATAQHGRVKVAIPIFACFFYMH